MDLHLTEYVVVILYHICIDLLFEPNTSFWKLMTFSFLAHWAFLHATILVSGVPSVSVGIYVRQQNNGGCGEDA